VDFVLKDFARMHGGEIFCSQDSVRPCVDLARAMAPNLPQKIIASGRRENARVMCPADDAHLTLEFDDHYVIRPTIQFSSIVDFHDQPARRDR